jgi:predicted mannosyl-3-phosphoglycerate phosphatase (HAD superfamily)
MPTPDPDRLVPQTSAVTPIVIFTAIDGILRDTATHSCCEARAALDLLATRGVPVVLISHGDAASAREVQDEFGLHQPFISDGGAALHIPRGYFEELDGLSHGDDKWEVFDFGVREPARAVRLLASLYNVRGEDVMTLGFGCDWRDRALLSAVDVPIIVRCVEDGDQARLLRRFPGAYLTTAGGPAGWSEAVLGSTAI